MRTKLIIIIGICIFPIRSYATEDLQQLAAEFFAWRSITQPATSDDINRVERPDGWIPDFSKLSIQNSRQRYNNFKNRLFKLHRTNWTRSDSIDFLLMRSAIERVHWELDVLRLHSRNPDFYVDQTLGALYELLVIHSPMTESRARNIITRLNSFPKTISDAKINLTEPVAVFADIALANCYEPTRRLQECADALKPMFPINLHVKLDESIVNAATALEDYIVWLNDNKHNMLKKYSVGREAYEYFLREIALIPYTPEKLIFMGNQEWDRSVAFTHYEEMRNSEIPKPKLFESAEKQREQERIDENDIRMFLEEKNIVSVPEWLKHYKNKKIPAHIAPFINMGVVDDLTSASRLDEDAVSYIPEPSPDLSFFWRATAQDPRPIIIHEGVPGHYFHLALSWANPNPIRRHFFDSGSIEGIGFYVEELMLQFGLFDDRPHTREIIYRFMRLRALRVDVDINLALGNYTIDQAGAYLAITVPMDKKTAIDEAGFFASTPGQAITYQIGKLQILKFLSDAKISLGDEFNLKHFHNYMMENGNVPIALQCWEYLGLTDEIKTLWPADDKFIIQ